MYLNLIEILSLFTNHACLQPHIITHITVFSLITQSIPWSEKQVFEITTVSEVSGNRAFGQQYCFLNTIDDFSVIIDNSSSIFLGD